MKTQNSDSKSTTPALLYAESLTNSASLTHTQLPKPVLLRKLGLVLAQLLLLELTWTPSLCNGSWLLSGKLAKMLLIDCEHNDSDCALTISVLEFTLKLMETGVKNDAILALIVFFLQYVLIKHEYWKYKLKHTQWRVTLKVLEVLKTSITSIFCSGKLDEVILDRIFCDSSIHNTLFQIVCTTPQALERLYILFIILSKFSKDTFSSLPIFHQAVFSSVTKPIPVVAALISWISYFRNPVWAFSMPIDILLCPQLCCFYYCYFF
ncbi:hypothetical protein M0R45_007348 [Rubus argutus]|uniref:Uncharacterized protein n=1 Tax=Rubus argutus TaxID=59490 RepID=A0AAW1XYI2_RUBAR